MFYHVLATSNIVNAPRISILCIKGKSPFDTPPFFPSPHLTIQFIKLTNYNDNFSEVVITCEHAKHDILIPHLRQLGWQALPPLIITVARIIGTIHNSSINTLKDLDIPTHKLNRSCNISHSMPLNTSRVWSLINENSKTTRIQLPLLHPQSYSASPSKR